MSEGLISFLVSWVPTILFIVMLLFFVILGFLRGFRKSLILAIQALVIFIICIIVFFVLVNDDDLDTSMYPNISFIFKSVMSGWPDDASSLREAIGLYIIEQDTQNSGLGSAVQLVITDNGAYFAAMINMVYRMIFAVFVTIIYFILLFIMYIIYLIAYPERRHKQKVQMDFSMKKRYKMYRKRRIFGATIGLVRGLVSSIIVLAFLGTSLYLISGSSTETEEINFGDDDLNEYYDLYECISDYDECGVYSILNSIKDSNEVPYYLYIADIVLSGKAKVINSNGEYVSTSFTFTSDFANYSKFLKKTINLVIKYADDDFVSFLISYSGDDNSKSSELMNKLTTIFGNEDFQKEFTALISDFDEGSFLINFGLSLIDTIAANYETFLTVDDENTKKILDILFDKENGIKVSNILTKEDAINLATTLIKIIGNSNNLVTDDGQISQKALTALALDSADLVVDTLSNLSCLNDTTKKTKFNNIFSQIFDLLINEWSASTEDGTTTAYVCYSEKVCKLANVTSSDVDWANEVKSVIKVLPKAAVIYESIDTSSDDEMLESIFNIFSTDNENYQKNEEAYDEIVSLLGDSKVIGALLSIDPIYEKTFGSIETSIEEQGGTFILGDISYANEKDNDGNITTYGETHNMLVAIKALLKAKTTDDDGNVITAKTIYDTFVDGGFDSADDITQMISLLLTKDTNGNTTTYYVAQSKLVRTILSSYISTINLSNDDTKKVGIYIGADDCDVISDSEGNSMKLINVDALDSVLEGVNIFVEEYPDVFNSLFDENDNTDILSAILANDKLDKLITVLQKSQIIEGTVASYLIVMLEDYEEVELPKEFSNVDDLSGWLSTSVSDTETSDGELIKLVKAIQNSKVEITKLLGSGNLSYIFNDVLSNDEIVNSLLTSDMLWLIISGMIQSVSSDSFKIIVPLSSQEIAKYTDDDGEVKNYTNSEGNAIYAIKKDEIVNLTNTIKNIVTIEEDTITVNYKKIFNKTDGSYDILDSEVMSATIVATLILNLDNIKVNDTAVIVIPSELSKAGTNDQLKTNFSENPWSIELPKLLDSVDLLLEISTSATFSFDSIDSDKLLSNISSLNDYADSSDTSKGTKLDILYESEVIKETLTKSLSILSDGMVIVPADALGDGDYIAKDELENIFKLLDGLDLAELSTEINSLSLNTNNTTYIVNSNVLLATITKYIIDNVDTANIVIPDTTDAITEDTIYSHISSTEMDKLLTSLLLLGKETTDANSNTIYEISLDDISDSSMFSVDSILDLNENDKLDTFLASTVVNYSITSILKNASTEGLSIIVPNTAYSDTNSVVFNFKDRNSEIKEKVNTIENETLTKLLEQVDNIMPETNGERTVSIKSIFINKTAILANDILHATIINYFCTNGDVTSNESIVIPSDYSKAAEDLVTDFDENIWYTSTELSKLFDALDLIFNISTSENFSFDYITTDTLNSSLSGMNDTPTGYTDTTKLDICYESSILKATFTMNIVKNESINVPTNALVSNSIVGDYINKTELELLFEIADDITGGNGITDISNCTGNINLDTVINTISSDTYKDNNYIVRALLTTNILDSLNSTVSGIKSQLDCYDSGVTNEYTYDTTNKAYSKTSSINVLTTDEITNMKKGLKTIIGTSEKLKVSTIKSYDFTTISLAASDVGSIYESRILQRVISSKIIDSIDNILDVCYNNTSFGDVNTEYTSTNTNYYQKYIKQTEVKHLLDALVAIDSSNTTGKVNVGSVSLKDVKLTSSKVETLLESNLAYPLVSNTIKDSVGKVPSCAYDTTYTSLISKTEIQNMVDSMLVILKTKSIDVSSSLSVNSGSITTDNIDDIIKSSIVWKLTSDKIVELVGSSYVATKAYDNTTHTSDTYTFISESELGNLIKVVGTKDSTTSTYSLALNSDLSYGLDSDKVSNITASYIAKAKVSNLIIDNSSTNSLVIPNSLVNKTYTDVDGNIINTIDDTELSKLLNALLAFGVDNASATNMSIGLPDETKQTTILESDIMKATITSKINITSSSSTSSIVYFVEADLISEYRTNDKVLVLNDTELEYIFAAIRIISTGSSLEVTLDLSTIATMSEDDQKTILDSNTVRIYVSGLLSSFDTYIRAQGYSKANTNVTVYYNTDSGYSSTTNDSYNSRQIIAIINYLHSNLGEI